MAMAHLWAAGVPWNPDLPCVAHCPAAERAILQTQLTGGLGCVPTSSMGRLFDAVSALAGVRQVAAYEAQAAIELEGLARPLEMRPDHPDAYRFSLIAGADSAVLALASPVIRAVCADVLRGVPAATIAARFHAAVVALIVDLAVQARDQRDLDTVALSGGVFQNAIILRGACAALRGRGFHVLRHTRVPPNDGGLALGQLMVGGRPAGGPAATGPMDK